MKAPIPETPDGYLARAKAVHKLHTGTRCTCPACPLPPVGEFLHQADLEGA